MADMNFQLVLEAIVKGQGALDKLAKSEEQIAQAAKAANAAQAGGAGKTDAAMTRQAQAMQRAATAAKSLGTGAHAAASASNQQAAAAERVATAEQRAATATKAHATAATQEAKAVQSAAGKMRFSTWAAQQKAATAATGAAAARAAARREMAAEAASQISPNGYLLGGSAAAATGAAVGMSITAGAAAAAYGLKQAIDFESQMVDIKKKLDLPAGTKWGDVESIINRSSIRLGMARKETAALAAAAASAGVSYEDLEGFIDVAAKAAVAWDMPAQHAAQRLAEIKSATRWNNVELKDFADQVNHAGDTSAAREADIVNMFQRAGASAKAAGVPLKTTLAAMTSLRSAGMQESTAASFWNAFTSKLSTAAKAGRGAKDVADGLKMIGLSAKEVERGMRSDATKTIFDVLDRLDKAKDPAGAGVRIMGREYWDELTRLSKDARAEMKRQLKDINSGAHKGSLDKSLALDIGTTSKQLERFHSMVSQIGDEMMRWALPPINDQLQKIIKSFETLKSSGFLANPDGNPIDRVADKTPVPFSPENRARFMPRGVHGYELSHKLKPTGYKTMFTDIEGVTPHIDVKQIDTAVADGVAKANGLFEALQKLNTTVTPNINVEPAISAASRLEEKLKEVSGALHSFGTFGLPGARVPSTPITGGGLGKQGRISTPAMGVVASRGGLRPTHVAGGGTTLHYAPRIHVAGGADTRGFRKMLDDHATHIASLVDREGGRRQRLSYSERA